MKKFERKDKNEKRRLAFKKRNVKKEMNLARYGAEGGSALIIAKSADFNRRFVAAFLALVFAISTMVLGINFATKAEDTQQTQVVTKGVSSNLVVDKTISLANDNTYTLTLSAYAKGAIKNVSTQIPTDYVLVVDQSGSMDTEDMPTDYVEATMPSGGWTFNDFENGTDEDGNTIDRELYVKVDNKYYRVYRKWGQLFEYQPRNTIYAKDVVDSRALHWFADEQGTESTFNSQYYYQPSSDQNVDLPYPQYLYDKIQPGGADDDNFYPINISSQGRSLYYSIRFNYYDSTGTKRYLRYVNNTTNSTANKDKETGNCIWYKNPSGGYFGPGDNYVLSYEFCNNFVLGWIDGNKDYDSFYTYGKIGVDPLSIQSGMYIQNPLFIGHVGYNSLAYRDAEGEEHIISHTDYCNANDEPTNDKEGTIAFSDSSLTLYEATGTKLTRLEAVQNALNEFVSTVASQTDDSGVVDHRVAIVGFSSDGFNNNELLTNTYNNFSVNHTATWTNENGSAHYSSNGYAHDGVQKASADSTTDYYRNALISAHADDDDGINDALPDGISGLTAHGGTQPGTGLEMAYKILQLNDKSNEYAAGTRNAVVIFFTDGRPGNYSYVNQYDEANTVVGKAYTIKSEISNVQIYSVGVFGEADGNPLTYQYGSAGPYYYYDDLQDLYNSLYCGYRGNRSHTNDNNEKVSSNKKITDVSLSRVSYQEVNYWPKQIEETYYPDYAKTTSAFYGNTTASWSWSTGGVIGIGATSHSASGQIPTYRLSFYWRDHMRNSTNYPKVENDTIFDYMTVVSSSYPNATSFDNGWSHLSRENKQVGNYNSSISSVRRDKGPGRYYMSASDSANLNEIFVNIASEATTSTIPDTADLFLQDVISDNFDLPANPESHVTARSYVGTQAVANGAISFSDTPTTDHFATNWTNKKLVVSGFSFSENYIMNGKPANNNQGTEESQGKKLEVTITGLTPSDGKTGDALKSNVDTATSDEGLSGIMQTNDDESITCLEKFESPTISRHKYTLTVGGANTAATVGASFKLVGEDGSTALTANDLQNALVEQDGGRTKLDSSTISWSGASSKTMYLENLPTGTKIVNSMSIDNDSSSDYSYSISAETGGNSVPAANLLNNDFTVDYADTTYDITSVAQNRDIAVHLTATPSDFVDNNYSFTVNVSWSKDGETGSQTLTMPYNNGQIADQTVSVPYGATVTVSHEDFFYDTKISDIGADQGTSDPVTITNVTTNKDIYITDTARSNIGEGIAEDTNPTKIILCSLVGLAVLSGGAGAAYVYRKKDEFVGR